MTIFDNHIEDISENEHCIAFFKFSTLDGKTEGICKISRSKKDQKDTYVNLSFVVDTCNKADQQKISKLFAGIHPSFFKKNIPKITSITSLPITLKSNQNYVHQIDLTFSKDALLDPKTFIPLIVTSLRQNNQFLVETPQWWKKPSDF